MQRSLGSRLVIRIPLIFFQKHTSPIIDKHSLREFRKLKNLGTHNLGTKSPSRIQLLINFLLPFISVEALAFFCIQLNKLLFIFLFLLLIFNPSYFTCRAGTLRQNCSLLFHFFCYRRSWDNSRFQSFQFSVFSNFCFE